MAERDTREHKIIASFWMKKGLRAQTANCLADDGIETIEQLRELGRDGVMRMPNVGRASVDDMERLGLLETTKPGDDLVREAIRPLVSMFSDRELLNELRARGYRITLRLP